MIPRWLWVTNAVLAFVVLVYFARNDTLAAACCGCWIGFWCGAVAYQDLIQHPSLQHRFPDRSARLVEGDTP